MRITDVRTMQYEIPLLRPIGDANSPTGRRHAAQVAVFVETDEGLTGVSLPSPSARTHIWQSA